MMPLPKSLKILLVEDDSFSLRAHHKLLGDLGYFPDTAEDGKRALSLPIQDYHLIFIDIGLPDINEVEVTAQIRRRQHTHHRPRIIGLTAFSTPDVVADCLNAGMDEVIAKPLTIAKLSRLLAAAVAPHTEVSYA